ncbi:MAG: transposase [Bacillota bacterium]
MMLLRKVKAKSVILSRYLFKTACAFVNQKRDHVVMKKGTTQEIASECEIHPTQLRRWKEEAIINLPKVFSDRKASETDKAAQEKKINQLYSEIGRLTTQLNWLKKNLASTLTRADRLALVERDNKEVSLSAQAKLLSLNRIPLPPAKIAYSNFRSKGVKILCA